MFGNFDTDSLAELAVGRLRARKRNSKKPCQGHFRDHHGFYDSASLDNDLWRRSLPDLDRQINEKLERLSSVKGSLLREHSGVKEQGSVLNPGRIGGGYERLSIRRAFISMGGRVPGIMRAPVKKKVARTTHGIKPGGLY